MSDTGLATNPKTKIKQPSMWKVVMHNDDYTPMDFVMAILEKIFHKNADEAASLMMRAHQEGRAAVATYTRDVCETKIDACMAIARQYEHPFTLTCEEA